MMNYSIWAELEMVHLIHQLVTRLSRLRFTFVPVNASEYDQEIPHYRPTARRVVLTVPDMTDPAEILFSVCHFIYIFTVFRKSIFIGLIHQLFNP